MTNEYVLYDEQTHRDAVVAAAKDQGEDHALWYEDGPADWDKVWERIETGLGIDLGSNTDAEIFRTIRKAYNKAKREAAA